MRYRRLSTRILVWQLTILVATVLVGFVFVAVEESIQLDQLYEHQALAIAQTVAGVPEIRAALEYGDGGDVVDSIAERIRQQSGASYVVVTDMHGVRYSHPDRSLIGQRIGEPVVTTSVVGPDNGETGRSANGRTPLDGPTGRQVGEVSVGIPERTVSEQLVRELPAFGLYLGMALAGGVVASYLLASVLKRRTFGLELDEIANLLQEREATLHGIREGVIALDQGGRVTVVNDEARRLLGLGGTVIGARVDELLPEGRLRDVLTGRIDGPDVPVVTDDFILTVNRRPVVLEGRVQDGGRLGAVITLRDRTELSGLLRELDSVRGLTDALRAQQHEFSNRMHVLAGLLELGDYAEALEFATDAQASDAALAESIGERIGNPLVVGLILAKSMVAAERGVRLTLTDDSWLGDAPPKVQALLTILGNLIDNAIDATAAHPHPDAEVTVSLVDDGDRLSVRVSDSGPGIPPDALDSIFTDGYTTKPARDTLGGDGATVAGWVPRRGLGLTIVHRLTTRIGGRITVCGEPGATFTVELPSSSAPVPDALLIPLGGPPS